MNRNRILISLVLLILVVSLFFYESSANKLSNVIDLKNQYIIDSTDISEKNDSIYRYSHTFGLYINKYESGDSSCNIVNRATDIFSIYYDEISGLVITADTEILIQEKIPINQWLHITVVADNTQFDLYQNGKLIKSAEAATSQSDYDQDITIGDDSWVEKDAFLASYIYFDRKLDPNDVLKIYQEFSNKYNTHSRDIYSVDVGFLKDKQNLATLTI